MRPSAPAKTAEPAPAASAAPRARFGIGNLINRMAGGHHASAESQHPPAAQGRLQPPVTAHEDDMDGGSEHDRIEIPAFLRRQAN